MKLLTHWYLRLQVSWQNEATTHWYNCRMGCPIDFIFLWHSEVGWGGALSISGAPKNKFLNPLPHSRAYIATVLDRVMSS
jgi:hypothetical protein